MNSILREIKNKLYYFFAEKNWGVRREYGPYVDAHREEHQSHRLRHWWLLLRLNWHYRVLRSDSYLLDFSKVRVGKLATPYYGGAESTKGRRQNPYFFAKMLLSHNVVSFDIFDTLLLRKLNQPKEVFMLVGAQLDVYDYYTIRVRSEQEAREIKAALRGTREVTLDDIYERVAYHTGIDPKKGAQLEFETELDMCFANPYMKQVFEIVKATGTPVYATSDMYLPRDKMERLLKNCGYEGFADILVSCDYLSNKGSGDLFNILRAKVGDEKKIIHIGDNFGGEIKPARKAGIDAIHYISCRAYGDTHRSLGISPLVDAAYRGVVNTTLHNGLRQYDPRWEFGFVYGGLTALGYASWIHAKAKRDGAEKILFLARDGLIFKAVYDILYRDIPCEYAFWSRVAAIRNLSVGDRGYLLSRMIQWRANSGDTIGDLIGALNAEGLRSVFESNGLADNTLITAGNAKSICDILIQNWNVLEEALEGDRIKTKEYLERMVRGRRNVAIVDIGFTGQNTIPLRKLLSQCGVETVKIYLIGGESQKENAPELLRKRIAAYMYSYGYNKHILEKILSKRLFFHSILEKMFSAGHASFRGCLADGGMEFSPAEAENRSDLAVIQDGIMSFCERYIAWFQRYPFLFNITGEDAFAPLQALLDNPDYTNQIIGNFVQTFSMAPRDQRKLKMAAPETGGKK